MVASLVPAADRAVNLGRRQLLRQICTEEHVVEAQAAIAPHAFLKQSQNV